MASTNACINSKVVAEILLPPGNLGQVPLRNQDAVNYTTNQIEMRPVGANAYINAIFDTAKAVLSLGPIPGSIAMKVAIITLANAAAKVQKTADAKNAIIDITNKLNYSALDLLENSAAALVPPADVSAVVKAIYNVVKSTATSKFITTYPSLIQMRA